MFAPENEVAGASVGHSLQFCLCRQQFQFLSISEIGFQVTFRLERKWDGDFCNLVGQEQFIQYTAAQFGRC